MQITIESTYGATLLGFILAAMSVSKEPKWLRTLIYLHRLYGITTAQTCRYFIICREDRFCLKATVRSRTLARGYHIGR